jgi:hypothetical protein
MGGNSAKAEWCAAQLTAAASFFLYEWWAVTVWQGEKSAD